MKKTKLNEMKWTKTHAMYRQQNGETRNSVRRIHGELSWQNTLRWRQWEENIFFYNFY